MQHILAAGDMPTPDNIYGLIAFLAVLGLFGFVAWLFLR